MLLTVLGVSGFADLPGLPSDDDTALLRLRSAHPGSRHVLVLAPRHGAAAAREQAHVVVAADPQARVCVLPLDHHGLTLALLAYAALSGPGTDGDPSLVVERLRRGAARSRSLLWYPRLWGLDEPTASVGQALADLVRRTGWFLELGADPAVRSGRAASPFTASDTVHHLPGAPALLRTQLGEARVREVPLDVERAPYWARSTVELTVLRTADGPLPPLPACFDCGAGLLERQCPFCGQGPLDRPGATTPLVPHPPGAAVPAPPRYRPPATRQLVPSGSTVQPSPTASRGDDR